MIIAASLDEVRRQLKTLQFPKLVLAHDDKFNRSVIEQMKPNILVMNHTRKKQDTLRTLELPVNDVIARIAAKNNVAIGFDLAALRSLPPQAQAHELARIMDTIAVCRKAQTKVALLNATTPKSASAFLHALGASTWQASQALAF